MPEGELEPGDRIAWAEVRAEARRRFDVTRFRPGQRELIESVLAGRDVLGLLPTGAGKSLSYQLPSLFLKGAVVVVSPLIALMQDQFDRLKDAGVEAARLDSTLTDREQRRIESEIEQGLHDIVLLTPERLQKPENLEPLRRRGVALFVVDEAHCVSQWGHDFRPAYLQLRQAIEQLGRPVVLALTATAPPEVVQDILVCLGIPGARVVQTGIERDNLRFEVHRTVNREEKERKLLEILEDEAGAGIVYVATVRRVNELHAWLTGHGIEAARYHGQLRIGERERAQESFMRGDCRLIVATNAFGLGVDKPDVRFVVHWNFPDSVESYYQEAGRAGRDGAPARCALFYRLEDKRVRSFFLGGKHPRGEEIRRLLRSLAAGDFARGASAVQLSQASALGTKRVSVILAGLETMGVLERRGRRTALRRPMSEEEIERFVAGFEERHGADRERLQSIMRYGETTRCRMQFFREYFGEPRGDACGHCDNCASVPIESAVPALPEKEERQDAPSALPTFTPETTVHHASFGAGRVIEALDGDVRVEFEGRGERWVRAEYLAPAALTNCQAGGDRGPCPQERRSTSKVGGIC